MAAAATRVTGGLHCGVFIELEGKAVKVEKAAKISM